MKVHRKKSKIQQSTNRRRVQQHPQHPVQVHIMLLNCQMKNKWEIMTKKEYHQARIKWLILIWIIRKDHIRIHVIDVCLGRCFGSILIFGPFKIWVHLIWVRFSLSPFWFWARLNLFVCLGSFWIWNLKVYFGFWSTLSFGPFWLSVRFKFWF